MGALEALLRWDAAVRGWLTTHHTPVVDAAMVMLSMIGRGGAVWLMLAGAAAVHDRRHLRAAARVVLIILLTYATVDGVLKPIFARARPFNAIADVRVVDTRRPTTYSFPSGHAAMSFAGAVGLMAIWPQQVWLLALAFAIAFSRIYVGVHYPLDVLIGGLVGGVIGWSVVRWLPLNARGPDRSPARAGRPADDARRS
jgi:undecaprenyl-diphosphatase